MGTNILIIHTYLLMMLPLIVVTPFALGQESDRPYHHTHAGFFDAGSLLREGASNAMERYRRASVLLRAATNQAAGPLGRVISPVDHGADPTGEKDSADAFNASVVEMLSLAHAKTSTGLWDCGGATLDLAGGIYTVSRPVAIPKGYANLKVASGTLVAGHTFPRDAFVLSVGAGAGTCAAPATPGLKKGNCNELVDFSHLTVDAGRRAYGGVLVNHSMNSNLGPALVFARAARRWPSGRRHARIPRGAAPWQMVVGYTGAGISLEGSGAAYVHHAWLGAIAPGDPTPRREATGTAIVLEDGQHDAMVDDVCVARPPALAPPRPRRC